MEQLLCKCGCGETLPETNKNGYKWGHKGKASATTSQQPSAEAETETETEVEVDTTHVNCELNEFQIDRIWAMLPLPEKALAIMQGLLADRS